MHKDCIVGQSSLKEFSVLEEKAYKEVMNNQWLLIFF